MEKFDTSLPMMLYRALDVLMPRFRAIFREFDLTEQQWRILRVLWDGDELSAIELSDRTLIPAPSLVGMLNRLEKRHLVKRLRNKRDRRSVIVAITRDGRTLKESVSPRVEQVYRQIQAAVAPDVWNQLHIGLSCVCQIDAPNGALDKAANE